MLLCVVELLLAKNVYGYNALLISSIAQRMRHNIGPENYIQLTILQAVDVCFHGFFRNCAEHKHERTVNTPKT